MPPGPEIASTGSRGSRSSHRTSASRFSRPRNTGGGGGSCRGSTAGRAGGAAAADQRVREPAQLPVGPGARLFVPFDHRRDLLRVPVAVQRDHQQPAELRVVRVLGRDAGELVEHVGLGSAVDLEREQPGGDPLALAPERLDVLGQRLQVQVGQRAGRSATARAPPATRRSRPATRRRGRRPPGPAAGSATCPDRRRRPSARTRNRLWVLSAFSRPTVWKILRSAETALCSWAAATSRSPQPALIRSPVASGRLAPSSSAASTADSRRGGRATRPPPGSRTSRSPRIR